MTKLTIKNALTKVGVTDKEKQNAFLAAFDGKSLADISEAEITAELEKLGVAEEQTQIDFFAAVREPEILEQELDLDELAAVSGGNCDDPNDADTNNCTQQFYRELEVSIMVNGDRVHIKNCAATVETTFRCTYLEVDSVCSTNDGCKNYAVVYR